MMIISNNPHKSLVVHEILDMTDDTDFSFIIQETEYE